MLDIAKIEWLKIRSYSAFWWVLGITAVAYPGLNGIILMIYHKAMGTMNLPEQKARLMMGDPFGFNEVWHTVGYFSSWFIFIPAILVIMLMTNEYSFRTHRQNIIDGWTRKQFLTGKLLDVGIVTLLIVVFYLLACVVIGLKNITVGERTSGSQVYFIAYFTLQTFSQLSIAFLISFLVRNTAISLTVFIVGFLVLEPILGRILKVGGTGIEHFLPFEISNRLIPPPGFWGHLDPASYQLSMNQAGNHAGYTIVFTTILWFFCFRLNSRRDL